MTVELFKKIIKENHIPDDCALMSDSGWECCATNMNGIYYHPIRNEIVFTQGGDSDRETYKEDEEYYEYIPSKGWKMIYCATDDEIWEEDLNRI